MKKLFVIIATLVAFANQASSQSDNDLVQLSGLVVSVDSLQGLPLVSIRIKGLNKGTHTDAAGFFSFVVRKGDTIQFSFIGMKDAEYIIPKTLSSSRYSIVQPMTEDTFLLPEAVIHSFPTPEEFNYYFVKANIPDSYGMIARNNLRRQTFGSTMIMDARESQRYAAEQTANRYYYNGQLPPQRLFDPFAWAQFFNAWKRGDFKKKD